MVSLDGYEDWATGCNGDGQGQTSATECAFCLVDFSLKSPNGVLVLAVLLVEDLDEMLYEGTTSQGCDTHSSEDNLWTKVETTSMSESFEELGLGSVTRGALILVHVLAVPFFENPNEMLYEETTSPGLRHPFLGGD